MLSQSSEDNPTDRSGGKGVLRTVWWGRGWDPPGACVSLALPVCSLGQPPLLPHEQQERLSYITQRPEVYKESLKFSLKGRPSVSLAALCIQLRSGHDSQVLLGQMVWRLVLGYLGPRSTSWANFPVMISGNFWGLASGACGDLWGLSKPHRTQETIWETKTQSSSTWLYWSQMWTFCLMGGCPSRKRRWNLTPALSALVSLLPIVPQMWKTGPLAPCISYVI